MPKDERKSHRAKVESVIVRYRNATSGGFVESSSLDVSPGGTFVRTATPLGPGTLLRFEIQIASARAMHGVGRVVWKRDELGATPTSPAGMGIKFLKIDDSSRVTIYRLCGPSGALVGRRHAIT